MYFGRGQRHGAANVFDLKPCAAEILGAILFGNDADRALLHDLRHKLVCVEQRTFDGDKKTAWPNASGVVTDVRGDGVRIAGQTGISCSGNLYKGYELVCHRFEFYAGAA